MMEQLRDALATHWRHIATTYPPGLIEFGVGLFIQFTCFYVPSTFYLMVDLLFPKFSSRHKIQSEKRQPTRAEVNHCIRTVLTTTFVQAALHLAILRASGGPKFAHSSFDMSPKLPSLRRFLGEWAFASLAREVLFYSAHRMLHHPLLYKRIHKRHHLFKAPIAFAAQYAHPIEQLLANMLPVTLPLQLVKGHVLSFAWFEATVLYGTATVHSGYDFGLPSAAHHDRHHELFNVNYGVSRFGLDYWLGTDKLGWDKKNEAAKQVKSQ
ncbi:hypothetical protein PYCC9005_000168 [Savitreella phatthalungensis]